MAPKSPKSAKAALPPTTPKKWDQKPTPMDPISANKVWKEHCDKCNAIPALQGPFQIDPRNLFTITEKPTRVRPNVKVTKKQNQEAVKLMESVDPIKNREKPPPEKYDLPLTVAQEYGWYSKPLIKRNPLSSYPRHACEVTQYAGAYYMSQGQNPFARNPPITGQVGKGKEGRPPPPAAKPAKQPSPPKK